MGCALSIVQHCTFHDPVKAEVRMHNRTANHGTLVKIARFTHTIQVNIAVFTSMLNFGGGLDRCNDHTGPVGLPCNFMTEIDSQDVISLPLQHCDFIAQDHCFWN